MRRSDDTLRLFVAAYPAPEQIHALLVATRALGISRCRESPGDHIHLTLFFLGDRARTELEQVEESIDRACAAASAFVLAPRRLITLPAHGTPRLVAVEADPAPPMLELHRRLVARLSNEPRKSGGFLPHLTLCRFASGEAKQRVNQPVACPPFLIDRVTLVRSVLHQAGAEHRAIREFHLARPDRQTREEHA